MKTARSRSTSSATTKNALIKNPSGRIIYGSTSENTIRRILSNAGLGRNQWHLSCLLRLDTLLTPGGVVQYVFGGSGSAAMAIIATNVTGPASRNELHIDGRAYQPTATMQLLPTPQPHQTTAMRQHLPALLQLHQTITQLPLTLTLNRLTTIFRKRGMKRELTPNKRRSG